MMHHHAIGTESHVVSYFHRLQHNRLYAKEIAVTDMDTTRNIDRGHDHIIIPHNRVVSERNKTIQYVKIPNNNMVG